MISNKSIDQSQIFFTAIQLNAVETANEMLKQSDFKLSPETLSQDHKKLIISHPKLLQTFMEKYPEGIAAAKQINKFGDTWLTALAYSKPLNQAKAECLNIILKNSTYRDALLNKIDDKYGLTPLQWAVKQENWDAVSILLEYDPIINLEIYSAILKKDEKLNEKLKHCELKLSPETLSIEDKHLIISHPKIFQTFMEKYPKGINAAKGLKNSDTWLTLLVYHSSNALRIELLQTILNDPNYGLALLNEPGESGKTPLEWATERGNWEQVKILLKYNPIVTLQALQLAIKKENFDIVSSLLDHKPIIDLETYSAILKKNEGLNEKLKQCELKLSPATLSQDHKKLIISHPKLLQTFMEKYPEGIAAAKQINRFGDTWLTALAFSIPFNSEKAEHFNLILKNYTYRVALLNRTDDECGLTPLQLAVEQENWDAVAILLEYDPKMSLETYKEIINVTSLKQEQRQALIDKCNHTTDGANYFLELSLSEKEKRSIATLQSAISTWHEQAVATDTVKTTKILQSCIRGGLGFQDVMIMKDIAMTHKEDYANASSYLGKMIHKEDKDAATKYILEYKNQKIKNHLLNLIFTNFNHPLSLLYFSSKDLVKVGTYQDKNIKKLYQSYQPKERRGLLIKSSIFSIYSTYFTAQSCGIIPDSVGISPQAYFQQKDAKKAVKQAEKVRELTAQKNSAATTIQTHFRRHLKRKQEAAAEERVVAREIAASMKGMPLTTFRK